MGKPSPAHSSGSTPVRSRPVTRQEKKSDTEIQPAEKSEIKSEVDSQKYEHYKELGSKLRTLLRLPKAYRWACCEWFTANIDQTLLAGENDFCAFLRDTFPNLKTRKLTRTEWCKIRRLMGKPRRCSQAFLAEERALLANKRQKIRQLQQQKVVDVSYYRDLPAQIPLSLVIGTRVTAYLHKPHYALYTGIIDAVDTSSHGYRITFDRSSVGTHTVPDYEVVSFEQPEMLPLNAFQTRIQPRMPILRSPKFLEILGHQVAEALSGRSEVVNHALNNSIDNEESNNGQYPIKLLALMARVTKILSIKRRRIHELKSMNDEVERLHSLEQEVPIELKRSYASTILDLEKLNVDLDDHLKAVQTLSSELSLDGNSMPSPELVRNKCSTGAKEILESCIHKYKITNQDSLDIISHMVALMYHLKSLSEGEDNALQLKALNETIHDYKSTLAPNLISSYEDNVEVHVNYLKKWTG